MDWPWLRVDNVRSPELEAGCRITECVRIRVAAASCFQLVLVLPAASQAVERIYSPDFTAQRGHFLNT
jgi:hypothetical protein